jgi:hypothetical protein
MPSRRLVHGTDDRLPAEDDGDAALRLHRQDTDAAMKGDTTIPAATRARHVRKKGCCVCCGIEYGDPPS